MWILQEFFTYILLTVGGLAVLGFIVRILSSIFKK